MKVIGAEGSPPGSSRGRSVASRAVIEAVAFCFMLRSKVGGSCNTCMVSRGISSSGSLQSTDRFTYFASPLRAHQVPEWLLVRVTDMQNHLRAFTRENSSAHDL